VPTKTNEKFICELRMEISAAQERRGKLGLAKLSFIVALLGFGSTNIGTGDATVFLLYLVPFVGLIFDLYILGEHFGIKRAGEFLRTSPEAPSEEVAWEEAMRSMRDRFSYAASLVSSTVVVAAAALALIWKEGEGGLQWWYWLWLALSTISVVFVAISSLWIKQGITGFRKQISKTERCTENSP
jgi:hypothetical protein